MKQLIDEKTFARLILEIVFNIVFFAILHTIWIVAIPFLVGSYKEFVRDRKIDGYIEWNDVITDVIALILSILVIIFLM